MCITQDDPNFDVREKIRKKHLYQYQVAAKLGVSEMTLIRWMRTELSADKKQQILNAITELRAGEE